MTEAPKTLSYQDLVHIILGAHFYACGGGGALQNGMSLLEEIKTFFGSAESVKIGLSNIHDIDDKDHLSVLAAMGAPEEFLKKGYGKSPVKAFEDYQKLKGVTFATVSPVETGAIAYGMSLLTAAVFDIPIINGDGGGRAFPCLQLSTFANNELQTPIAASPCVLTSETSIADGGATVQILCESSADIDAMTRGIISYSTSFDQRASLASFAMTGQQLKQTNAVVPDMLTKSLVLGKKLSEHIRMGKSCFEVLDRLPGAQRVMLGKLVNINSQTQGGFDWVTLEYADSDTGNTFYVISQNENMLLWSSQLSEPIAMGPDLICCVTSNASLMSNDEILGAWTANPNDARLQDMAIYTLPAAKQIQQPWFHTQFEQIFQKLNYFGSYHPPRSIKGN